VAAVSLLLALPAVAAETPHPAKVLIDRADVAQRTDPEASRRDVEAALTVLASNPDPDLEVEAHLLLCEHLSERDRAAAEREVELARALLPKVKGRGLEAGVLTCQGTILETAGDNAQAREYYEQGVQVATAAGDKKRLGLALFARGYLQGLQGQYAAGLVDLKQSHALFEELELKHHALTALNAIAILYSRLGDYAAAIDMYSRALREQRAAGMLREMGVTLHNIGRANENLQQWDAALKAFDECYTISRQLNYARGEAYALRGLAAVANGKGSPQQALATLERAAALQRQTPDARLNAQILLARGVALHQLERLPASAAALQGAVDIFLHADSRSELRNTYAELASVQAEMGNWHDAYANLKLAQETAERLFRNQIDQRFATLRVEFDTAAKDKENAMLLRENAANQKALAQGQKVRRLQAAVIALTVVLAALLATLAVHQWRTTRRMRKLAMTDELTGVPNRRSVLAQLDPLLTRSGAGCAMLIIDIDHFKSINDQHGHPEGDEALKLIATTLRGEVREPAFIGRLGGEEFVVVLPGAGVEEAHRVAERFREQVMTLDTRRWLESKSITVSIGLTVAKASGDTSSTMLQRADAALYEAKRAGRNCVKANLPAHTSGPDAAAASPPAADIEYA
jgi:diguanylate cyclase (GGDEF)-like protein